MKVNKWLVAGLGIIISLVFLWLAFRNVKPEQVFSVIQQANFDWLIAATIVFIFSVVLIAWRWGFLLRSIRSISLGYLTQLVMIGYMGNNVYPFRTGEILRIVLLQRYHRVPVAKSTTTVVVERVFDGLVLLTFTLIAVWLLHLSSPQIETMVSIAAPLFLAALVSPTDHHGKQQRPAVPQPAARSRAV